MQLESKIKVQKCFYVKVGFSQFAFLCLNFIYETVLQFPLGTSINDVPRFLAIFDLPTVVCIIVRRFACLFMK